MMDVRSFNNVLKNFGMYTDTIRRDLYKFEAIPRPDGKIALVTFDENRTLRMLIATRTIDQMILALHTKTLVGVNGRGYRTLIEAFGISAQNPILRRDCLMEQVLDLESLELQLENIVWLMKARR